jgi:hypothetical protein
LAVELLLLLLELEPAEASLALPASLAAAAAADLLSLESFASELLMLDELLVDAAALRGAKNECTAPPPPPCFALPSSLAPDPGAAFSFSADAGAAAGLLAGEAGAAAAAGAGCMLTSPSASFWPAAGAAVAEEAAAFEEAALLDAVSPSFFAFDCAWAGQDTQGANEGSRFMRQQTECTQHGFSQQSKEQGREATKFMTMQGAAQEQRGQRWQQG